MAFNLVGILFGGSFVTGLILGLLQAGCITYFYSWIEDVSLNRAPSWLEFRYETFISILSFGFFLFVVQLSIQALQGGAGQNAITLFIQLALVIWCNPIPEIIQHIHPDGINGVSLCYQFMRERGIAWIGAILLVMSPVYIISGIQDLLTAISSMSPLFPLNSLIIPWLALSSRFFSGFQIGYIPIFILTLLLALWTMVFRSLLFQRLSGRI
jgi:hypothetical protein